MKLSTIIKRKQAPVVKVTGQGCPRVVGVKGCLRSVRVKGQGYLRVGVTQARLGTFLVNNK
jgi:hypothetical protein